jgi:uncharacterized protein (TIGR03083 family)
MEAEHARAYADSRARIIEMIRELDDEALNTTVPSCPQWRVRDLIAHVTGLTTDVLAGNVDSYGTHPWTSRQVDERRDLDVAEIIKEWEGNAEDFDSLLNSQPGFLPYVTTADLVTHEHDMRNALGKPGARDSEGVKIGIKTYVSGLRIRMEDLPPLRVEANGMRDYMVGKGEPAASVSAEPFELFRALGGRRTKEQIRAYDWEGDPTPYLEKWVSGGAFEWPDAPVIE